MLRGRLHVLAEDDMAAVAHATAGMSGADLKRLAGEVLMCPIRRVQQATHFAQDPATALWHPCAPSADGAVERPWTTLTDDELAPQPVTAADWHDCIRLGLVKPSNSREMIARYAAYTAETGALCH